MIGGWTGLTVAAFFAGFEFGIQPMLFHTANGTPLYAPYPLSVSIPATVFAHALVASPVEALVTALVVAYLQRTNQSALEFIKKPEISIQSSGFAKWRFLWIVLAVMIVLVPLGLLAPGTAWGEWGAQELTSRGTRFCSSGDDKTLRTLVRSDVWLRSACLEKFQPGLHPFGNCRDDRHRNSCLAVHDAGYLAKSEAR